MGPEIDFLINIIDNVQTPVLDRIMYFFTSLGDLGFIWITLTILFLIIKPMRKEGAVMALSLVFSLVLVNVIVKPLVGRARPFEVSQYILDHMYLVPPTDPSFPSGHTSAGFAAGFAAFFVNRKAGIPLILLAVLVSASRLYFAVHYPTDVIAGALIGIVMAYAAYILLRKRLMGVQKV